MPPAAVWRSLAFAFMPERAWQGYAVRDYRVSIARHFGALACIPAGVAALLAWLPADAVPAAGLTPLVPGSPFALALGGMGSASIPVTPLADHASPLAALAAAAAAYAATWLVAASGAAILWLLLPLFGTRASLRACLLLVGCAATPLLLASVGLLHGSLAPVVALAAMHSFYVAYLGLPVVTGVPPADAGPCLALAAIAALLLGQAGGYYAAALLSALH